MEFRYFFCTILLCTIFAGQIRAQSIDLYASTDTESIGDMASIDIRVNNFSDIISFQASINWDPDLMTFTGVTNFGIADFNEENFGDASIHQGHLRFVWEPEDANERTLADSTILFTANFELKVTDPSPILVGFIDETSNPAFPIEFANSNSEKINVNTFDGSVIYKPKVTGLPIANNDISIFPNPFNEIINISRGNQFLEFVKIYDFEGHVILEKYNLEQPFTDIHLSYLPDGIYFVRLRTNGKIHVRKIVKN